MTNLKRTLLAAAVLMMAASCGQNAQKPAEPANEPQQEMAQDEQNNPTIDRITDDILNLPEMKFEHAAIMVVGEPSEEEPYYTIEGGSNMETHFATSFWFHVYTTPKYEIKVYDIITDSELTLDQWRKSQ